MENIVTNNNIGTADKQEHYKKSAMQPIQVMQTLMSKEEFKGFLLGNVIKYRMRCNFKNQKESDVNKARQYHYWLILADCDQIINPTLDIPPDNWKEPALY